jgi:hypothetical protein
VDPVFIDHEGDDASALSLVISLNVQRRDLTAAQRAIVAARAWSSTGEHKPGPESVKTLPNSMETLAKQFKASKPSILQARDLLTEAPDLAAQVEACALSLAAAYEELQGCSNGTPLSPPVPVGSTGKYGGTIHFFPCSSHARGRNGSKRHSGELPDSGPHARGRSNRVAQICATLFFRPPCPWAQPWKSSPRGQLSGYSYRRLFRAPCSASQRIYIFRRHANVPPSVRH